MKLSRGEAPLRNRKNNLVSRVTKSGDVIIVLAATGYGSDKHGTPKGVQNVGGGWGYKHPTPSGVQNVGPYAATIEQDFLDVR